MKLYGYFRSSAAFRVRIALNLKGLAVEHAFVHLSKGEHRRPEYDAVNPQGLLPALDVGGALLTQSLAIMESLEETPPQPPILLRETIGSIAVLTLNRPAARNSLSVAMIASGSSASRGISTI